MQTTRLLPPLGRVPARLTLLLWLAAGAVRTGGSAPAEPAENPHTWKPRVTSVAVFKNGLGFFLRQGDVRLRDGWCVAGEVPPAHFGTLAIFAHAPDQLVDVVGSGPGEVVEFNGTDAPRDTAAKRSRLQASLHLSLQLTYRHKDSERTAAGRLVALSPDFAVLESDDQSFAVPLEGIEKLQVLERPLRVHVTQEQAKAPPQATLGMAYLRKGITWIPEYTLKVLDDQHAELTLRGTLVNEAEDLVHCDVNFVVGVPHFLHTDYLAPVAVGQVIRTIGTAVAPRELAGQGGQIMNRAALASDPLGIPVNVVDQPVPPARRDLGKSLGNLPQMEGPGGGDFTVYTRKDLTVRRGEKAIVTLFVKKIRYSHIYRWSPPESLQHFLVLHNQTDTAWTTGPCLAVNQGSPLSEDLLKYVPRNGSGEIPVTTAINVAQEKSETEVDRKLKAHEPAHQFFVDLVTLKGELKIRNFERTAITVLVSAALPGRPLSASEEGVITVHTDKLQLLERSGRVQWQLPIEPGATKTVSYQYERYVPSR